MLKHSEVDKVEQIRSLPAIDTRSRNEFEKCGLALKEVSLHLNKEMVDIHNIGYTFASAAKPFAIAHVIAE